MATAVNNITNPLTNSTGSQENGGSPRITDSVIDNVSFSTPTANRQGNTKFNTGKTPTNNCDPKARARGIPIAAARLSYSTPNIKVKVKKNNW